MKIYQYLLPAGFLLTAVAHAIGTVDIADGAVTTPKLAASAVTAAKLGNGAVTAPKLGTGAVTEAKLGDGAVTAAKLGAGAVTAAKLGDGAVTSTKLGQNSVNTTTISDNAIITSKIATGAVSSDKITDGAITSTKLGQNSVSTIKISDSAVTAAKLGPNSVNTAKITDSAITTSKIATGAVSNDKITDGAVTVKKLAADALNRPIDMIMLENDSNKWTVSSTYRNMDGTLNSGFRKIPFAATDNLNPGFFMTTSLIFDDANDAVIIAKEGLYAFKFSAITLAAGGGEAPCYCTRLPAEIEINLMHGSSRLRISSAHGMPVDFETDLKADVVFPAKAGDVVYAVASYVETGPGIDGNITIKTPAYLRNRFMSISLIHPGPGGNYQ